VIDFTHKENTMSLSKNDSIKIGKSRKQKTLQLQQRGDIPRDSYELLTAVFEVSDTREVFGLPNDGSPRTLCVMRYVRLDAGLSRGSALQYLTKQLVDEYNTKVSFAFWCDGYTANGGSPIIFIPNEDLNSAHGAKLL
jgi:hypothetical protein